MLDTSLIEDRLEELSYDDYDFDRTAFLRELFHELDEERKAEDRVHSSQNQAIAQALLTLFRQQRLYRHGRLAYVVQSTPWHGVRLIRRDLFAREIRKDHAEQELNRVQAKILENIRSTVLELWINAGMQNQRIREEMSQKASENDQR